VFGSRFLEVDPVEGGSCNNYDYVCGEPINAVDLGGTICFRCAAEHLAHAAYTVARTIGHAINQSSQAMVVTAQAVWNSDTFWTAAGVAGLVGGLAATLALGPELGTAYIVGMAVYNTAVAVRGTVKGCGGGVTTTCLLNVGGLVSAVAGGSATSAAALMKAPGEVQAAIGVFADSLNWFASGGTYVDQSRNGSAMRRE